MSHFIPFKGMARVTGLEPATSGVTGRHSNQLSYTRALFLCLSTGNGAHVCGNEGNVNRFCA